MRRIGRPQDAWTAASGIRYIVRDPSRRDAGGTAIETQRPNIIYFVCHDLGKQLGCYGAGTDSPNLDRFAAGGVTFTSAFCNSTACSPSRGCAMTGQYAHTNGLMGLVNMGWSLPVGVRTIVDHLNDAGYETAHFGLQHERRPGGANRYQLEGHSRQEDNHAERAVDSAIEFLRRRVGSDRPFYLNIGTVEVHNSRWQGNQSCSRLDVYGMDPPERVAMPAYIPDVPALRSEMGKLQGAIRFLDGQVGRLLAAIDQLGYRENTLVVFTTDHGIANVRAKGTLYDRGVEITLLMQLPGGVAAGREVDELVGNIDLAPTLLAAAGAPTGPEMQGRSFWPLLTGGDYQPRDALFIERNYHQRYDPIRAVRTRRFHYIRNFGEDPRKAWLPDEVPYMNETYDHWYAELWPEPSLPRPAEELFDVAADPQEFRDLAADPAADAVRAELAGRLDEWMRQTDDPLLQGAIPDKLNPWPDPQ